MTRSTVKWILLTALMAIQLHVLAHDRSVQAGHNHCTVCETQAKLHTHAACDITVVLVPPEKIRFTESAPESLILFQSPVLAARGPPTALLFS